MGKPVAHAVSGTCLGGPLHGSYYSKCWVYPADTPQTGRCYEVIIFAVQCESGGIDHAVYEVSADVFLYVGTKCSH